MAKTQANAAINAHWAASSGDYAEVAAKGAAVGTLSGLLGLGASLAGAVVVDRRWRGVAARTKARSHARAFFRGEPEDEIAREISVETRVRSRDERSKGIEPSQKTRLRRVGTRSRRTRR